MTDTPEDEWSAYRALDVVDPTYIGFSDEFFTPTECFYERRIDELGGGWSRLLDIGCGNAQKLVHLVGSGAVGTAVGIDASPGSVAGAAARLRLRSIPEDRAVVERVDVDGFVTDEPFDLVLALQVVNFVEDLDGFFAAARAWVTPGGRLVVSEVQRPVVGPVERLKSSPSIRRAFRQPSLAPIADTHHRQDAVVKAAIGAGFAHRRTVYGHHALAFTMPGLLRRLGGHRPRSEVRRRARRSLYLMLRSAWLLEDRLRARKPGALFWTELTAPSVDDGQTEEGGG